MEIKMNISDKQIKRLKDFGLGGIAEEVMKDMKGMSGVKNPKPLGGLRITSTTIEEFKDGERLSREDIETIEGVGRDLLERDLFEVVQTKNKHDLFKLLVNRLDSRSLSLLVQSE